MQPLTQVQIIRSLGEALAWFEKELTWSVEPAELRHLTGRIGELYAAMITSGQMALATNQRGYDVVSAEGDTISVKTITTSTHVSFRKSTLTEAKRVMILRVNVDEHSPSIEELFRGSTEELLLQCKDVGVVYQYVVKKRPSVDLITEDMKIIAQAIFANHSIIQYENSTICVETDGVREPVTRPILRQLAVDLNISPFNGSGNLMNTRQLGAALIAAINLPGP